MDTGPCRASHPPASPPTRASPRPGTRPAPPPTRSRLPAPTRTTPRQPRKPFAGQTDRTHSCLALRNGVGNSSPATELTLFGKRMLVVEQGRGQPRPGVLVAPRAHLRTSEAAPDGDQGLRRDCVAGLARRDPVQPSRGPLAGDLRPRRRSVSGPNPAVDNKRNGIHDVTDLWSLTCVTLPKVWSRPASARTVQGLFVPAADP
jgi:hypothetical protein